MAASVVIVTRNRSSYLNFSLTALERQTFPTLLWEVIVVDNASHDGTMELLECHDTRLNLRVRRASKQLNLAEAYNEGLKHACGKVIFFIDDTQIVDRHFIKRHLEHQAKSGVLLNEHTSNRIYTHIVPMFDTDTVGIKLETIFTPNELLKQAEKMHSISFVSSNSQRPMKKSQNGKSTFRLPPLNSGQFSAHRDMLLQCGGFDERFSSGALARQELALRWTGQSLPLTLLPNSPILHQVLPQEAINHQEIYADLGYLFSKYADLKTVEVEQQLLRQCMTTM